MINFLKLRSIINILKNNCSNSVNVTSLKYSESGDPIKVVNKTEEVINKKLNNNEVLIKFLASVIHPSDINTIQGQYPIKPPLPAIGGNEGYAQVIDPGTSAVLKEGDFVIPRDMNSGTWTNYKICTVDRIIKIKHRLPPEIGAISAVNPGTAFRMLKNFTTLTKDSVIIQNGGTSAVAIYATQLAKMWGIKSISIIRARSTVDGTELVKNILEKEYGATFVLTEEEVKTKLGSIIKEIGPAKLALNCVGGKAVLPLLKGLGKSGIIVTYGGMNRLPMQLPVSSLIFSDIHIRGFWMSAWSEKMRDSQIRQDMLNELGDAFHSGSLKPSPYSKFDLNTQWKEAISKSVFTDNTPEGLTKKCILIMDS